MLTQHVWECKTCNLQSYVLLSWIMARQVCFLKAMCLWWFRKTHVMLWQVKFFSSSLLSQLFLLYSLSFSCMIVSWDCICALKFAVEYTVELPPGLYKLELSSTNWSTQSESIVCQKRSGSCALHFSISCSASCFFDFKQNKFWQICSWDENRVLQRMVPRREDGNRAKKNC